MICRSVFPLAMIIYFMGLVICGLEAGDKGSYGISHDDIVNWPSRSEPSETGEREIVLAERC